MSQQASAGVLQVVGSDGSPNGWDPEARGLLFLLVELCDPVQL